MLTIFVALERKGMPPIQVNHLFSTEIDPIKQGYIERNFHPKILFRDAREFISDDSTTAITAYGGEVEIPCLIDILIAGFVCKDLSSLSTKKKTLNDGGESGDTWKALYTFVKKFRPSVVLIENVKSTIATWNEVKGLWDEIEYECAWHYCDTKDYGLPQTRQRMYMVAINRGLYGKGVEQAAKKWQETMKGLARQCSSPFDVWLHKDLSAQHDYTNLMSESDWVLCKIRYELMRYHMKLGLKHPISQCNVNGSICPPDFANRNFYFSQSSRVYDCFDVAHLVAALEGYDSLHKMVVWDVSQNADRFKTKPGLLPAITPNGCDFVSNKQTALGGAQLLVLQGMPVDKLLFANETPRELQDLAGNAMSTPVIGASLLATLIHCLKGFHQKTAQDMPQSQPYASLKAKIITPKSMKHQTLESSTFTDLDVKKLLQDAKTSTQLCVCEGAKDLTRSPVQVCKDCEHTACTNCSGNPGHAYGGTTSREQDLHPTDFIRAWRPLLPARLTFSNFPDLLKSKSLPKKSVNDNDCWQEYAHRVAEADLNSQCFSISEFLRLDNLWKVLYVSAEATLELHIQGTIEWRMFVKCSKLLPGNCSLREILKQPVARGLVQDSLLEPSWELFIPQTTISTVTISPGSEETVSSWRNRLGLQDFNEESIPTCLDIANSDGKVVQPDLIGRYTLLPNCGTAMGSLYVKKSSHPPIYFFLECDLIGHGDLDSFVFSEDLRRMPYGNARILLARLDCSWRPWKLQNKHKSRVSIVVPGRWVMSKFRLEAKIPTMRIGFPISSLGVTNASRGDCSQMVILLNVHVREHLNTSEFSAFSWALEKAKLKPSYPEWQEFYATSGLAKNCQCAPPFPRILWSVNEKFEVSAHEDRKPAAQFERAVKTRPSIFDIKTSAKASGTDINVAINLSVLQHCARSRILNDSTTCSEAWRLLTNHMEAAVTHFPKFYLLSNSEDSSHPGPRRMKLNLTETQRKSLTWMERQEFGIPLTIEEIEEGKEVNHLLLLFLLTEFSNTCRSGLEA
jgi:site-specific DNA-cytosine methylase